MTNDSCERSEPKFLFPQLPNFPLFPSFPLYPLAAGGVKENPQDAIPLFQYSNIPSFQFNCERSELSSENFRSFSLES
jgi:hypothetical protein